MNTEYVDVFLSFCGNVEYVCMNIYPRQDTQAQIVASAERGEPQACDRVDWQLDRCTEEDSSPSTGISDDARL